jgi:acyloxyacyl hydrolase
MVKYHDKKESRGGEGWQLIESVDGFHPSQTANVLTAEIFWEQIMNDHPNVFGPQNPFNEKIREIQEMI